MDGAKSVNQSVDILKSTDEIFDVAKTSDMVVNTTRTGKNAGEFAKPYPKENLPEEISDCLSKLLDDGDKIQVSRAPDLEEISLMSRQESVEFASVTVGDRNYVLRGNTTGTTISQDLLEDMIQNKGILNCHSHPYIGDFRPSPSDLQLAEILNHQKEFRIVTPDGMQAIYTKDGVISIENIGRTISAEDISKYLELFGG